MRHQRAQAISTLEKNLKGPGSHLGDVVWLSIGDVHESRDAIRAAFLANALPEHLAPADLTDEAAFGLAIAAVKTSERGLFLRRSDSHKRGSDVVIVRHQRAPGSLDEFLTCAKVGLEPVGGTQMLSITHGPHWDQEVAAVCKELSALTSDRLTYCTGPELSHAIVTALLGWCGGIRLRERGNIYWCPAGAAQITRSLQTVLRGIGSSDLAVLPVHDNAETRQAIGSAASDSFEVELNHVFTEIESFKTEAVRTATLERRLSDYQDIASRVELYADVLDAKRAKLVARLEEAKTAVREMIAASDAA